MLFVIASFIEILVYHYGTSPRVQSYEMISDFPHVFSSLNVAIRPWSLVEKEIIYRTHKVKTLQVSVHDIIDSFFVHHIPSLRSTSFFFMTYPFSSYWLTFRSRLFLILSFQINLSVKLFNSNVLFQNQHIEYHPHRKLSISKLFGIFVSSTAD